jgi:hypothetical protein
MAKATTTELWKKVKINIEHSNPFTLEVSNLGRLRTTNTFADKKIVTGSLVNGYRIIRLKLFKPREPKVQLLIDKLQKKVAKTNVIIKQQIAEGAKKSLLKDTQKELDATKAELRKVIDANTKERIINHHCLIHRLVATAFLPKPKAGQKIVAHTNFNKTDNNATNLQWMSLAENIAHQQKSPHVKKARKERAERPFTNSKVNKLTIAKVAQLKKQLLAGKPIKDLVAKYNITETQIYRIKKGENWGKVEAAK